MSDSIPENKPTEVAEEDTDVSGFGEAAEAKTLGALGGPVAAVEAAAAEEVAEEEVPEEEVPEEEVPEEVAEPVAKEVKSRNCHCNTMSNMERPV